MKWLEKRLVLDKLFAKVPLRAMEGTAFEKDFEIELIRSDVRRVQFLATLTAACIPVSLLLVYVPIVTGSEAMREVLSTSILGLRPHLWGALIAALATMYELAILALFDYAIRHGKRIFALTRYANTAAEMSIPTFLLYLSFAFTKSPLALNSVFYQFYFGWIVLAALRLDFRLCALAGLIGALEYAILSQYILNQPRAAPLPDLLARPLYYYLKASVLLATGLIAGFVATEIRKRIQRSVRLQEERQEIFQLFGQHVSPSVVNKLLEQRGPSPLSEVRHVCVMFLDIRRFTQFSEGRSPVQVIDYLNGLFAFMIEIINANQGIINKFLGDGFMAVFGAPVSSGNDCRNAYEAARQILAEFNRRVASGELAAGARIGISLHAGDAVTGNVGSTQRKEYTVIGKIVNIAARIEELNKRFDSQLLVSDVVHEQAAVPPGQSNDLGLVEIRGLSEPVRLHKIA